MLEMRIIVFCAKIVKKALSAKRMMNVVLMMAIIAKTTSIITLLTTNIYQIDGANFDYFKICILRK